jgi:hypothetical protein
MNLIYTTENSQYSPISHGSSYLYEKFDRIQSFLRSQLKPEELNRLAQPVVNGNNVEWYGMTEQKMQLLGSFPEPLQRQTELEYLTFIQKIKNITSSLINNNDPEKKAWGNLIKDTFNIDNNMLISDGSNWAIIWGWEFRNQLQFGNSSFESDQIKPSETPAVEQKLEPQQNNQPTVPIENNKPIEPLPLEKPRVDNKQVDESILIDDEAFPEEDENPTAERSRLSFWQYIKRFFRWLAYRFWGLMLLIIYTLLIIFLTKQCTKKPDCSEFQKVERELKFLEGRIKERCSENVELNSENQ